MNLKKNVKINTKMKYLFAFLLMALFFLGCYFFLSSPSEEEITNAWTDSGFLKVGQHLTILNTDNHLSLLESKDVLSANGLYYTTWTIGDSKPYENSEGETVDLYEAQLYLLLSESKTSSEAQTDVSKWSAAAKTNYEILTEEEINCKGLSYQLITYRCTSEGNPYDRGISAFGSCGNIALCAELTCLEEFEEDLRTILIHFLENCTYSDTNNL